MRRGRVDAHGAGQRERLRLRVGLVAVVVVRVVHLLSLATPGHNLATPGHNLATPGHRPAAPGNTWPPIIALTRPQTAISIVAPPAKFKFPALFSAEPRPIGPVPEINVPGTATNHHRKFRRDRSTHIPHRCGTLTIHETTCTM